MSLHCQIYVHKPELPVLQQNHPPHTNQLRQLKALHPQRLYDAADEKSCHFDWNPVGVFHFLFMDYKNMFNI